MRRFRVLLLALAVAATLPVQRPAGAQSLPPDSTVQRILNERLTSSPFRGLVVGLLDADGNRRVVAVGVATDRVFEIGSITKTFTASILAGMVADGSVRLEDPVAKYDSTVLNRYVGEYELVPTFHIVVMREGAGLFIQATGQPKFPIYAESESEFFLKVVDAQISFSRDGLILHQNGQNLPGRKIR